jgi:hypothetical protein
MQACTTLEIRSARSRRCIVPAIARERQCIAVGSSHSSTGSICPFSARIEIRRVGKQEAQRVAQAAIHFDHAREDFLSRWTARPSSRWLPPTGAGSPRPACRILPAARRRCPATWTSCMPLPSTTKPWVSKPLYGARPSMAQPVSRMEWNQPRCWSEPSRYRSAGPVLLAAACEPRSTCHAWCRNRTRRPACRFILS